MTTNRFIFIIGIVFVVVILADLVLNNGTALLFLAKKMILLINYLAFWR